MVWYYIMIGRSGMILFFVIFFRKFIECKNKYLLVIDCDNFRKYIYKSGRGREVGSMSMRNY